MTCPYCGGPDARETDIAMEGAQMLVATGLRCPECGVGCVVLVRVDDPMPASG